MRFRGITDRIDRWIGAEFEETLFYNYSGDARSSIKPPDNVRIEPLAPEHAALLGSLPGSESQLAPLRFKNGDVCYVAYLDDRLVHYSWVRRSGIQEIPEADLQEAVLPGQFWIYHCWTASEARGRKIYPSVLTRIINDHFQSGFSLARIYTSRKNVASQSGIQYAGFRLTSTTSAFRLGSRHWKMGRAHNV
ncbi:MAG: hypothetical protein M3Z09_13475 [Acidobacteriota bacterium]|nr:hypothetical protein [Acidobacteriota bacterium]